MENSISSKLESLTIKSSNTAHVISRKILSELIEKFKNPLNVKLNTLDISGFNVTEDILNSLIVATENNPNLKYIYIKRQSAFKFTELLKKFDQCIKNNNSVDIDEEKQPLDAIVLEEYIDLSSDNYTNYQPTQIGHESIPTSESNSEENNLSGDVSRDDLMILD